MFVGLDVERVTNPEEADFVLNTGPPTEYSVGEPMPKVDAILEKCAHAQLPMVCVNPDIEVKRTVSYGIAQESWDSATLPWVKRQLITVSRTWVSSRRRWRD